MKKIYSYLLGMAALAAPAAADANVVTINIDDPQAVTVTKEYWNSDLGQNVAEDVFNPLEEVNQYTYDEGAYEYLYIRPKDGYKLVSVMNNGSDVLYGNAYYGLSCSDSSNGQVYTVTTANLADIRTATAFINIDDASKVRISRGGSGGEISVLNNGMNEIKFDPNTESSFQIGPKVYSYALYSVKLDGEAVPESYGSWYLTLRDNSQVEIKANWPDESHKVTITVPAECPDMIKSVKNASDNEPIEGDFTQGVMIKAGTNLAVDFNTEKYAIDEFSVNGEVQPYFYGSWTGRVRDTDLNIVANGHVYGTFEVTLNVNDPSLVKVYKNSYADQSSLIEVTAGDNTISYTEAQNASYYLCVQPEAGNVLRSFTVKHAGAETAEEIDNTSIQVKGGDVITVEAGPKVRDKQFNLLFDEGALEIVSKIKVSYMDYNTSNRETIFEGAPQAGANYIKYSESELPFDLELSPVIPDPIPDGFMPQYPYIFINDLSEGQTSTLQLSVYSLHDGDIVRVFKDEPTLGTVTVTLADDTKAEDFALTCDGQTVADWATDGSFTAFVGSTVAVKWTAPEVEEGFYMTHTCTLDNEPLEADTDGVCTFKVESATPTLLLAEQKNVGINNAAADAVAADEAVYNLQGIRVATASELNRLPVGIYICGGKKTVVK